MPGRATSRLALAWVTAILAVPAPAGAQSSDAESGARQEIADGTADYLRVARELQSLFERRRIRLFPLGTSSSPYDCDEIVGRFCTWFTEGEWYPKPEDPEIVQLRGQLLLDLDALRDALAGSDWLLGQRVWYRLEAGVEEDALSTARACGLDEVWWCSALEGLALHNLGRFVEAEVAFERALSEMDPERAEQWRILEHSVQPSVRRAIEQAAEISDDSVSTVIDRLWTLADPLYLIEGNDRLTEHYARWTVSVIHEDMRNPHGLRWGRDLEELTVRNGRSIGWERSLNRSINQPELVTGHRHPEAREFMPPLSALTDPAAVEVEELTPDRERVRSLYAPEYAPVFLPMDAQIAVFPRADEMAIVASASLPEDTTLHADHDHDVPWDDPGDQAGMPDRIGLYAVSASDGTVSGVTASGRAHGGLMLTVPPGEYILSAESWSPELRRAGRTRQGTPRVSTTEDIATLSDLVLTRRFDQPPASLRAAVSELLPSRRVARGQSFGIAWEVSGLGFRAETLDFELSVERTGRNPLRRLGDFLRITSRPQPLELYWEEPGPTQPETVFRHLNLDLPDLDAGQYEITLTLRTPTRSDTVSTLRFEVVESDR